MILFFYLILASQAFGVINLSAVNCRSAETTQVFVKDLEFKLLPVIKVDPKEPAGASAPERCYDLVTSYIAQDSSQKVAGQYRICLDSSSIDEFRLTLSQMLAPINNQLLGNAPPEAQGIQNGHLGAAGAFVDLVSAIRQWTDPEVKPRHYNLGEAVDANIEAHLKSFYPPLSRFERKFETNNGVFVAGQFLLHNQINYPPNAGCRVNSVIRNFLEPMVANAVVEKLAKNIQARCGRSEFGNCSIVEPGEILKIEGRNHINSGSLTDVSIQPPQPIGVSN